MKKLFTLAAASAMAAAALSAQAQITLDGKVDVAEIATTVTPGKYQLISTYSGAHLVADKGFQTLYVGASATKLNIAVIGSFSQVGLYPGVVLYLNVPGKTGVPAGTKLAGGAAPDSPLKQAATMDFEVDYGVRLNFNPTATEGGYFSYADYTNGNAAPVPDAFQGNAKDGVALTATATTGPLLGSRVAYSAASSIATNTTNSGIEFEFDLAALGLTATSQVDMFLAYVTQDGAYTIDTFPPIAGRTTALAADQDFTAIAGKQFLTYRLGTGALASKGSQEAAALRFGIYPNPASATAVHYTVPQGRQDVALSVYDATGRQVRSLRAAQAGSQSYPLSSLRAGIYVVKLNVGGQETSGKVVIE